MGEVARYSGTMNPHTTRANDFAKTLAADFLANAKTDPAAGAKMVQVRLTGKQEFALWRTARKGGLDQFADIGGTFEHAGEKWFWNLIGTTLLVSAYV